LALGERQYIDRINHYVDIKVEFGCNSFGFEKQNYMSKRNSRMANAPVVTDVKMLQGVLDALNSLVADVCFLQIGSNDGKTGDPIHEFVIKYNWNGILVEPVNYLFEKLKGNYANAQGNLTFLNVAVSDQNTEMRLHRLPKSSDITLPFWYDQLASLHKDVVLTHKTMIPNIEDLMIEESVRTMTIGQLLDVCSVKRLDLVHIDTEGHDDTIMKQLDFRRLNSQIVIFEHKHMKGVDVSKWMRYFEKFKFRLFIFENDIVAVSEDVLAKWNDGRSV